MNTTTLQPMFNCAVVNDKTGAVCITTRYPEDHRTARIILSKSIPATGPRRNCLLQLSYPENWDHQKLHDLLARDKKAEIDGWTIHTDSDRRGPIYWLTNPYGIDVGYYPATLNYCATILNKIATDKHEHEWA